MVTVETVVTVRHRNTMVVNEAHAAERPALVCARDCTAAW